MQPDMPRPNFNPIRSLTAAPTPPRLDIPPLLQQCDSKSKESETESHMKRLSDLAIARVRDEVKKLEKEEAGSPLHHPTIHFSAPPETLFFCELCPRNHHQLISHEKCSVQGPCRRLIWATR